MKLIWVCGYFYLLLCFYQNSSAQTTGIDSTDIATKTVSKKFSIDGFIAGSININRNWKEVSNSFLVFSGTLNLSYKKYNGQIQRIQEFRGDLCYQKYIDSIWIKTNDKIYISSIWIIKSSDFLKNSFSLSLKTQMTNTWNTSNQTYTNNRKWESGPMLPFIFTTGYGINLTLPKSSYINIAFAAIRINSKPRTDLISEEVKILAKTDKVIFQSEYGLNLQSNIEFIILKKVKWENLTTYFTTGLDKKVMNLDMQNILSINPFRFLKIRFENKLTYDYLVSDNIQQRFELLLGYYFEKK